MNQKFWRWVRDQSDEVARTLYLEGVIAEESWLDDDITPAAFKAELTAGTGPVTIWLNSPGGDVFAAARIYNLLMDYPNDVTVKIDGIAASAASVVAMAGTKVLISPVGMIMIHNPMTLAIGDSAEMEKAIAMLSEVKESILNAYEIKTGLSRAKLSHLMDGETWLNAKKAVELGFADGILFERQEENTDEGHTLVEDGYAFSRRAVTNCLLNKLRARMPAPKPDPAPPDAETEKQLKGIPAELLEKRLLLISH